MKKIVFTIFLFIGVISVNAQSFGVKAGIDYNNWRDSDNISDMVDPLLGFQAGAFVNLKLSDKLSLQPELLYTLKGVSLTGFPEMKYKFNYLDIPIMMQYHFNDALSVNLGPELNFLTKATFEYSGGSNDASSSLESFTYGLNFGLSYQLPMGLVFDARYAYGLSDIFKPIPGDEPIFNDGFQVTVAYVIFNK